MIDLPLHSLEKLREDEGVAIFRGIRPADGGPVLLMAAASEHPSPSSINQIKHAFSLRDELDSSWAIRLLEPMDSHGIPSLWLDDPDGDVLDREPGRSPSLDEPPRLAKPWLQAAPTDDVIRHVMCSALHRVWVFEQMQRLMTLIGERDP